MSRNVSSKKEYIGCSPYEMVFRGEKKTEHTNMYVIDFNLNSVKEAEVDRVEDLETFINSENTTWLNIIGLDNLELMKKLSVLFGIDSNIMADIMNPSIRPKVEEFENGLFVTLKTLQINNKHKTSTENISLLIMKGFVISFLESSSNIFEPIRERILNHKTKIRTGGPDYLAFALLDVVIDNYIYTFSELGLQIEKLENKINDNFDKQTLDLIKMYKQELNYLRRRIKPAHEMVLTLAKMETEFIQNMNRINYKELQDNINEANELADSYREMLYDLLNICHTSAATRLNDIMKFLTIISVLFTPLSFVLGMFGIVFDYFPEMRWQYGFFAMWGIMLVVAGFMIWYFKRKDWF